MNGYERIDQHCNWLLSIGMPIDRVDKLRAQMRRTWDKMRREARADHLMGQRGAKLAAEHEDVTRMTIYNRARKYRKLRKTYTAA